MQYDDGGDRSDHPEARKTQGRLKILGEKLGWVLRVGCSARVEFESQSDYSRLSPVPTFPKRGTRTSSLGRRPGVQGARRDRRTPRGLEIFSPERKVHQDSGQPLCKPQDNNTPHPSPSTTTTDALEKCSANSSIPNIYFLRFVTPPSTPAPDSAMVAAISSSSESPTNYLGIFAKEYRRPIFFCALVTIAPILYGYDGTYFTALLETPVFREYDPIDLDDPNQSARCPSARCPTDKPAQSDNSATIPTAPGRSRVATSLSGCRSFK